MDYRNSLSDSVAGIVVLEEIFHYKRIGNGIITSAITSNDITPRGQPSNDKVQCCFNGLSVRETLMHSPQYHNMQRPSISLYNYH